MAMSPEGANVAQQVGLILQRLDSISALPEIATKILSCMGDDKFDRSVLSNLIDNDVALTSRIYSLACERNVHLEKRDSVSQILKKLPASLVRDAILSVKIYGGFETNRKEIKNQLVTRRALWIHSLATACCASRLAEVVHGNDESALAFSAGLLHDIGKFALEDTMPKSFERLVQQAKKEGSCLYDVERRHLGLDHAIAGKRLAQKWGFPEEIVFAVWLHHTNVCLLTFQSPAARLAGIVHLADIIARQSNIGVSGSFNDVDPASEIIEKIPVSYEQIELIKSGLDSDVSRLCELLGLEVTENQSVYCQMLHQTAAGIARENIRLTTKHNEFALSNAQMGFISEFLQRVDSRKSSIELAADFAVCWQTHYQTGPVCVCIWKDDKGRLAEVATVDESGSVSTSLVNMPTGGPKIVTEVEGEFVLSAEDYTNWIFEQLDFDINLSNSKMVLLNLKGETVGVVVFEQRLPINVDKKKLIFRISAFLGAGILALVSGRELQDRLAEEFADALSKLDTVPKETAWAQSIRSISEMAAGAAHELNNPLAVVSGRTQLLYDTETDENKKKVFKQIHDRAMEMSEIVSELMSFAKPGSPRRKVISLLDLITQAVERIRREKKSQQLEVELEYLNNLGDVYVDAEQVIKAICNVILNSLESYKEGDGPVRISADCVQTQGRAVFEIIDRGCGMDGETLKKVFEPFFSAKDAGRQRGMGLAHAKRLLEANGGSIHLDSEFGQGTTVTISLQRSTKA